MTKKFFTHYTYDSAHYKGEVNDLPSLTSQDEFESLADKLARFTSFGFPHVSASQYDDTFDPTSDPGFDPTDLAEEDFFDPLNELTEEEYQKYAKYERKHAGVPSEVNPESGGGVGPNIASSTTTDEKVVPQSESK